MRKGYLGIVGGILGVVIPTAIAVGAEGDAEAGARTYRACAACHSLEPGRHLTGPSLSDIWGRKAATVEGFTRYSKALESADLVWSEATLDAWLAAPQKVVPGNRMTFRGMRNPQARADLIAFLKSAGTGATAHRTVRRPGTTRGPDLKDLKAPGAERQVATIRYCDNTYHVTTVAGGDVPVWEFNLRFKTDSSTKGPPKGRPALLRAGMMGDRVFVIFADPGEISTFIEKRC